MGVLSFLLPSVGLCFLLRNASMVDVLGHSKTKLGSHPSLFASRRHAGRCPGSPVADPSLALIWKTRFWQSYASKLENSALFLSLCVMSQAETRLPTSRTYDGTAICRFGQVLLVILRLRHGIQIQSSVRPHSPDGTFTCACPCGLHLAKRQHREHAGRFSFISFPR